MTFLGSSFKYSRYSAVAPGMSPAWCNSMAWRSTASAEGGCCAATAQPSQTDNPRALAQALTLPPLCQHLTNGGPQFRRLEVKLAEPRLEGDLAVAADQV